MLDIKEKLNPRNLLKGRDQRVLNREVYYKGKEIIHQGDEGYRAYYIESGAVEILVEDGDHMLKVCELGPGDIFGEMALINHEPRSATVRAIKDTTLTIISREEIEGKINRLEDEAMQALINVLTDRLKAATQGQLDHYRNLTEFQDRIAGIIERVHLCIEENKRDAFRKEIEPLLRDLQSVIQRYQG